MWDFVKALLTEGVPALIDMAQEMYNAGKEDAEKYRNQSITISVSFGGGEGEAVKAQRTIEAKLPDDFSLDD